MIQTFGDNKPNSLAQNNIDLVKDNTFKYREDVKGLDPIPIAEKPKSQYEQTLNIYATLAKTYFFERALIIGSKVCRIGEIEIYNDSDPFMHKDPHQYTSNCFYFHRQGKDEKSYKGGTYKGLDITIGCAPNICGSFLIRSILTPDGFIEGPCNVVDYILDQNKFTNVEELVKSIIMHNNLIAPASIYIDNPYLRIVGASYDKIDIYNGPRVGLNLKKEQEPFGLRSQYVMKPFRFTCFPAMLKINRHGMVAAARFKGIPDDAIVESFKLQASILGKWITQFIKGKNMSAEMFLTKENSSLDKVNIQLNAQGFFSQFDI